MTIKTESQTPPATEPAIEPVTELADEPAAALESAETEASEATEAPDDASVVEPTPEPRKSKAAEDKKVAALIKKSSDRAVREALARYERDATKKAEREKMDAEERAKAEKVDAEARAEAAEKVASEAKSDLEFYRAMSVQDSRLEDSDDSDYIKAIASSMVADGGAVDWADAIEQVRLKKPHLFISDKASEPVVKAKKLATTAPAARKGTSSTESPPTEVKSVRNMTKAEFREHRQKLGLGIH